jgi:hypothetical protein
MASSSSYRPAKFAAELVAAGTHAAVTLWCRLPCFGALWLMSDAQRQTEAARMVSEKMAAGFEGSLDAGVAAARLVGAAATGRLRPGDLACAPTTILRASLRPAFRRVRANSRRLRRRRRAG